MMDQIHIHIKAFQSEKNSLLFKHLHCTDIAITEMHTFVLWTLCKLILMVFPTNEKIKNTKENENEMKKHKEIEQQKQITRKKIGRYTNR